MWASDPKSAIGVLIPVRNWKEFDKRTTAAERSHRSMELSAQTTLINPSKNDDVFNHPTWLATSSYHANIVNWILVLLDRQRVSRRVPPSSLLNKDGRYEIAYPSFCKANIQHAVTLGRDFVILKRSVKGVMKFLGLHGVIRRNETTMSIDTCYIRINHFQTIIAFEAPVNDGVPLAQRLVTGIMKLRFPSNSPPMNYIFVEESLATKPTFSGIAIAEIQSRNHQHNSSGKVYNLSNPSSVERKFTAVKSGYKEYAIPAMNIFNALSRNTSSEIPKSAAGVEGWTLFTRNFLDIGTVDELNRLSKGAELVLLPVEDVAVKAAFEFESD